MGELQMLVLPAASPTTQGALVIGKSRSRQMIQPQGGSISGCPGEQLSGPIAGEHCISRHLMPQGDGLAQGAVAAIGIHLQSQGLAQAAPNGCRWRKGHQRGAEIQHLLWGAAQAQRCLLQVAAMAGRNLCHRPMVTQL
jgi:hypothetical protein